MEISRSDELRQNAALVRQRINQACQAADRNSSDVKLLWVSKTHPISDVDDAIQAGATNFGENKVQEGLEKFSQRRPGVSLHIIGPVQSNKWRKAALVAQWLHTVDSVEALHKYETVCTEFGKTLEILFQVNTSEETAKSGLAMANAKTFLQNLPAFPHLHYRGLMTIGKNTGVAEDSRIGFAWLRNLRDELHKLGGSFANFTELSMGMSDDLEVAIAEGATWVRIGTAIFGARDYSKANPL
ncbi:MAG TPA: YggS family pyridoxal phosphate-dependent enzyme [Fibrobacteraceae bacterium]|nr:YggS family pyridoxal phosphate-dependent enzyme [Fibrobacteraceae bacterium]